MRQLVFLLAFLVSSSVARAEPWRFSAGVSPMFPVMQGAGVEADVMPAGHFRFVASAYTFVLPTMFQRDNSDEGWSIRDSGGGIGAEYFLQAEGRGLFVGALAEAQNHHDERMGLSENVLEAGVAAELGYRWMPWRNLYVTPRLLLVMPLYYSHDRKLGGVAFDEAAVRPVPLLSTGWQF